MFKLVNIKGEKYIEQESNVKGWKKYEERGVMQGKINVYMAYMVCSQYIYVLNEQMKVKCLIYHIYLVIWFVYRP